MECFGTTDFDNNSRLITLSAIIISGLHCISISISISILGKISSPKFANMLNKIIKSNV